MSSAYARGEKTPEYAAASALVSAFVERGLDGLTVDWLLLGTGAAPCGGASRGSHTPTMRRSKGPRQMGARSAGGA
jgi:hypothetical protein